MSIHEDEPYGAPSPDLILQGATVATGQTGNSRSVAFDVRPPTTQRDDSMSSSGFMGDVIASALRDAVPRCRKEMCRLSLAVLLLVIVVCIRPYV